MGRPFADRRDAGRRLAAGLAGWRGRDDVVVLALPRRCHRRGSSPALPVAPADALDRLGAAIDERVCVMQPHGFMSVGPYYDDSKRAMCGFPSH